MPTRPPNPDPTGASQADPQNPFATLGAGLGAGLDFFQDWLKAAGSALPNMPGSPAASATPGMSAWTMPTLDPAELEKRIQDLKTVQFWLEQNARMIAMTIQGLEVQRMTLSTLKGMNVSMDALRESLKARAEAASTAAPSSPEPSPAAAPDPAPSATSAEEAPGTVPPEPNEMINPMRWWDTLTQQFTHLASQAAQTVNDSVGESVDMLKQAQQQAAEAAQQAAGRVDAPTSAKTSAKRSTRASQAGGTARSRAKSGTASRARPGGKATNT